MKNLGIILVAGTLILGALGYLKEIFSWRWGKKASFICLIIFLLVSVGQIIADKIQEGKIKQLEKASLPRTISIEQKNRLVPLLSFESKFQIIAAGRLMDQESINYAEQIADIFKSAKWTVGPTNKTYLDNIDGDVCIAITNDKQIETINKISEILNSVGISCKLQKIRKGSIADVKENTIYLIIGSQK